jgi:hypothetical protein
MPYQRIRYKSFPYSTGDWERRVFNISGLSDLQRLLPLGRL